MLPLPLLQGRRPWKVQSPFGLPIWNNPVRQTIPSTILNRTFSGEVGASVLADYSGYVALVGAPSCNNGSSVPTGSVGVFYKTDMVINNEVIETLLPTIIIDGVEAGERFGSAMAMTKRTALPKAQTVVIASPNRTVSGKANSGAVSVYELTSNPYAMTLKGTLTSDTPMTSTNFGTQISLSTDGSLLLVADQQYLHIFEETTPLNYNWVSKRPVALSTSVSNYFAAGPDGRSYVQLTGSGNTSQLRYFFQQDNDVWPVGPQKTYNFGIPLTPNSRVKYCPDYRVFFSDQKSIWSFNQEAELTEIGTSVLYNSDIKNFTLSNFGAQALGSYNDLSSPGPDLGGRVNLWQKTTIQFNSVGHAYPNPTGLSSVLKFGEAIDASESGIMILIGEPGRISSGRNGRMQYFFLQPTVI